MRGRLSAGAPGPVEKFKQYGEDFIVKKDLRELVENMNLLEERVDISYHKLKDQIDARDREILNSFS